jgi:disulfide bond formation protein DsbB
MERISLWLNRNSLYIALLAAWIAMCGSLYFSEVRGYVPCVLCWYQRILMYPLTGIIAIGLLRRDGNLPYYVLPFSLLGLGVSTYHYLLEKTDLFRRLLLLRAGRLLHDAVDQLVWLCDDPVSGADSVSDHHAHGAIALLNGQPEAVDEEGEPLRMPWLPVSGVIVAVLAIFTALFISGAQDPQDRRGTTAPFATLAVTPGAQVHVDGTSSDPTTLNQVSSFICNHARPVMGWMGRASPIWATNCAAQSSSPTTPMHSCWL